MLPHLVIHQLIGIALVLRIEVLVEHRERELSRIDADLSESFEDSGSACVFPIGDRLEVWVPVVGSDTVLVVDTRLVDRSYPRKIDRMGNEDVLMMSPNIMKRQIPLFAFGVGRVFAVLRGGRFCVQQGLYPTGCDTQTDLTIMGDEQPTAVVWFVGHKAQCYAVEN